MSKTKKSLGRGFDSLIPTDIDTSLIDDSVASTDLMPVTKLARNPSQPRTYFDEAELERLASSIKRHGILQPLLITPHGQKYMIIAGERRFRAAQIAGLTEVPVIIRSSKELEQIEIGLIENVQRVDLSPMEQALSIAKLHQQFKIGLDEIADRIGKATTTVHNIVRLLQLPTNAKAALQAEQITEGHARAILSLKGRPEQQDILLKSIVDKGWSVRQAEQYASAVKSGAQTEQTATKRTRQETPETKRLSAKFGVPVTVQHMAKGGKLVLRFKTEDEFRDLLSKLQ